MIRFISFWLLLAFCGASYAAEGDVLSGSAGTAPLTKYYFPSYHSEMSWGSKAEACSGVVSTWCAQYGGGRTCTSAITSDQSACWISNGANNAGTYGFGTKKVCSDGSAPDTTKPLDQQCPRDCPAAGSAGPNLEWDAGWRTGPDATSAWASGPNMPPNAGCYNKCKVSIYLDKEWIGGQGSVGYYKGGFNLTSMYRGDRCTEPNPDDGNPPEPTTPPPEKNRCPLGTKQIGIDSAGTPICKGDAPPTDPNKQTTTTTTTNSDGSKTTTTTTTTTNSDGSKTTQTTTTTTQPDGTSNSNETTTTGNTPSGAPGKPDSTDKDQNDLCKQHPTLNVCKNSQISGSCSAISCEGDAIQCAIAREVAARNCSDKASEDSVKASSYYQVGQDALAGTGNSGLPSPDSVVAKDVGSLSSAGWLGGGKCFSDVTVNTRAGSFVIPLSKACDVLIMFRYLFMFVAAMVAFRILSRAFLGD